MQEQKRASRFFSAKYVEPLVCVALFAFSFLITYRFSLVNFDSHHSGLMYKTALDLAHGKVLFLETFTQYGALTSYIQGLSVLLFGESVRSILLITALFYAASHTMLYLVAHRLMGRVPALAAAVATVFLAPFFLWDFHPWSSVFALFFLLLSLYTLQTAVAKDAVPALVQAALSGLFAALTFWCRQPVGFVTALAGLLCILFLLLLVRKQSEQRKHTLFLLAAFGVGLTVGILLLLIPILASGGGHDFVRQSLSAMVSFASARSGEGTQGFIQSLFANLFGMPFYLTRTKVVFDIIWLFLPVLALILALLTGAKLVLAAHREGEGFRTRGAHVTVLIYAVYAVAEWHQYYPVSCLRHWYWGAFLCAPAVFLITRELLDLLPRCDRLSFFKGARARVLTLVLVPLVFFAPNMVLRMHSGAEILAESSKNGKYENEYYTHLNGLYLTPEVAAHYDRLFEAMNTLQAAFPNVNVVNTTEIGIYAVFGENFCPLFNNAGDAYYAEYPQWLEEYIKAERPIVIGAKAPDSSYVLYLKNEGHGGAYWGEAHGMPAYIYIPEELAAALAAK